MLLRCIDYFCRNILEHLLSYIHTFYTQNLIVIIPVFRNASQIFQKTSKSVTHQLTKSLGLSECKEPILRVPPSTVNKRFMCSGRNLVCISFGVCVPWMNWLPRIRTSSFKRTNSCLCFRKRKTWKWKIVIGNGFLSILKHYIDTFWHFSTNWKPLIQSVLMSKIPIATSIRSIRRTSGDIIIGQ